MIDLGYPRERMLYDIRATQDAALVVSLADPAARAQLVALDQARLELRVGKPEEVLERLNEVLAARFSVVALERLERDLLLPIKKALGNAYKRGNRMDPEKWITLELVLTRAGAFVQVSDQGAGFDVAETCARFAEGAHYFAHHGSGFRKFHKAGSVVSFDDGGRTFRACFSVAAACAPRRRAAH